MSHKIFEVVIITSFVFSGGITAMLQHYSILSATIKAVEHSMMFFNCHKSGYFLSG